MLRHLHIRNYALIDALDLDFYPGLNTITGETGAGKSILLGALGLILGQRADSAAIKQHQKQCVVEAVFDVRQYGLRDFIEALELEYDEELTIRRIVSDNGKSRAFVNDLPVTVNHLKGLTERIIDIHSQHANLLLQDAQFQITALDLFASLSSQVQRYRQLYSTWRNDLAQLDTLRAEQAKNQEDYDYCAHQYAELEQAQLRNGELEELEARQKQLAHADELASGYSSILSALHGEGEASGVLESLRAIQAILERSERIDPTAANLLHCIEENRLELRDLAADVEVKLALSTADPDELLRVETRQGLLYQLMAKHRCQALDELIALRDDFAQRLEKTHHYEQDIERLASHCAQIQANLLEQANLLHQQRQEAGVQFAAYIGDTLKLLGIPLAQFSVEVERQSELGAWGIDEIRFLFAANQNQPLLPLAKVASGGEISRVMLSLKRLMAMAIALPTIVFDEIDNGVSGRVATQMGSILEEMGKRMQVINITHLPQIAARGEHHFLVYKEHAERDTQSHIRLLSRSEREQEIAKMLSGESVSAVALENARELLNHIP